MVKVRVNRFCCIWHMVTRISFNCGKVNIVANNDLFTDLNYMVCIFQYDSMHSKFHSIVKAEDGRLVVNRKARFILQK